MHRCIMCDELNPVYIPDDIIDDYGIYSCGSCGFEIECARERPTPPLPVPLTAADILAAPSHTNESAPRRLTVPAPALVLAGSDHG